MKVTKRKIKRWLKGVKFKMNPWIIESAKQEQALQVRLRRGMKEKK